MKKFFLGAIKLICVGFLYVLYGLLLLASYLPLNGSEGATSKKKQARVHL